MDSFEQWHRENGSHAEAEADDPWLGDALAELWRVMGTDTVRSPRLEYQGGEWDYLKSVPRRQRRRLTGAGFLTSSGLLPDQAAELIGGKVHGCRDVDAAMSWYVATTTRFLDASQRHARATAHKRAAANRARLATAHGQPSYFQLRNARAAAAGYRSFYFQRNYPHNERPTQ